MFLSAQRGSTVLKSGFVLSVMAVAAVLNIAVAADAAYVAIRARADAVSWPPGQTDASAGSSELTYSSTAIGTETGWVYTTQNSYGAAMAKAWADYGVLKGYATGRAGATSGSSIAGAGSASAVAAFGDRLMIDAPGRTGQQGTIRFQMDVHGLLTGQVAHPGVNPGAAWELRYNDDWYSSWGSWDYGNNRGIENAAAYFNQSFTFGEPFTFEIKLTVSAGPDIYSGTATADYFGTARMDGIGVSDSAGQPVIGFTATSESGVNYLPEPATGGLLAVVIALAGRRRR